MHIYVCVIVGGEASVIVAVKQLVRYPVDLYYLVDVSASMKENLDHVRAALLTFFHFFFPVHYLCMSMYF